MNPHAVQLDTNDFPPANSKAGVKMRSLYNERIKSFGVGRDERLTVIFEAWKGSENTRGIRVVTFTKSTIHPTETRWEFATEMVIPTPSPLTTRKGY